MKTNAVCVPYILIAEARSESDLQNTAEHHEILSSALDYEHQLKQMIRIKDKEGA